MIQVQVYWSLAWGYLACLVLISIYWMVSEEEHGNHAYCKWLDKSLTESFTRHHQADTANKVLSWKEWNLGPDCAAELCDGGHPSSWWFPASV